MYLLQNLQKEITSLLRKYQLIIVEEVINKTEIVKGFQKQA